MFTEEFEKKIFETKFSEKDLTSDMLIATEPEPDYLSCNDIEEALDDYIDDSDEPLESTPMPTVFVFKKDKPLKILSDDIYDLLYNHTLLENDNFDYEEVTNLLKPLNNYLEKINNSYSIVGIIDPADVKPLWEKTLK